MLWDFTVSWILYLTFYIRMLIFHKEKDTPLILQSKPFIDKTCSYSFWRCLYRGLCLYRSMCIKEFPIQIAVVPNKATDVGRISGGYCRGKSIFCCMTRTLRSINSTMCEGLPCLLKVTGFNLEDLSYRICTWNEFCHVVKATCTEL